MNNLVDEPYKSWVNNGLYSLLYKELSSTNLTAITLMEEGKIAGPTAIISDNQKKGRGQFQTKWHASPGKNMTFSLAIPKLHLNIQDQFMVNKAVCLALLESLKSFSKNLTIKWPNDIYYQNKKLAGVLIENQIQGDKLKSGVIGVGLNVNEDNWPKELSNPISLKEITDIDTELDLFKTILPGKFYKAFNVFLNLSNFKIDEMYNANMLGFDQWLKFKTHDLIFEGKIKGTNSAGNLVLENKKGEVLNFPLKQLKYIF